MKRKAFTLIESLLYMTLSSILILAMVGFVSTVSNLRVRINAASETEFQAQILQEVIKENINASSSVTSPSKGTSAATLSMTSINPSNDPIVISSSSGQISIQKGAASPTAILSDNVSISGLTFKNLGTTNSKDSVYYSFTLTFTQNSYTYQRIYHGATTIR